jgi:L-serine dehydratase
MLGLSGQDPEYIPVENIDGIIKTIEKNSQIVLAIPVPFTTRRYYFLIRSLFHSLMDDALLHFYCSRMSY